jgi:RNA polymerase sigma-70 factor, ECF subfamily
MTALSCRAADTALAPAGRQRRPRPAAEAFVELQHEHRPALLAFVTKIVRDPMLAEDVVQDAMVRCWQRAAELDEAKGAVRGWLFRVAHNIAIDRIRARRARVQEVAEAPYGGPVQRDHAETVVNVIQVRQALAQLSPAHREVLYACYFEGRTAAETAEQLGIPTGTVKSRLYYAMQAMRDLLQVPEGPDSGAAFPAVAA